jgi:hypothetical protein
MNEPINEPRFDNPANSSADALQEKLSDAMTPGYQVEFDPDEAQAIGAFVEDALSELDAIESDIDLVNEPANTKVK